MRLTIWYATFYLIWPTVLHAKSKTIVGPTVQVGESTLTAVVTELVQTTLFWSAIGTVLLTAFNIWWSSRKSAESQNKKELEELKSLLQTVVKDIEVIKAVMPQKEKLKEELRDELKDQIEYIAFRTIRDWERKQ